jgi:hypothetical protein
MAAIDTLLPKLYLYDTTTPVWVDISDYVQDWKVTWGRTSVWESMRARTLTVKLANSDRRFEPGYSSGPYVDWLHQGMLLHLDLYAAAGASHATYAAFFGTLSNISLHYPGHTDTAAYATFQACDPLAILAKEIMNPVVASGTADVMVKAVLDELVWTASTIDETNIAAGTATLQAYDPTNESLLSIIEKIAWSDERLFYLVPNTEKRADAYLIDAYGLTFPVAPYLLVLDTADIFDITLGIDDDQCYSHVRLTAQANDIGAAVYVETGGHIEDQWTRTAHGLVTEQVVRPGMRWTPTTG